MEFGISLPGHNCMLIARRLYLAGDGPRPVRAGSAWPLSPDRSVRRGSGVKRDFVCTFTRHLLPVPVVLRSQSRLRLEGRTRTLSGPSPDLTQPGLLHIPMSVGMRSRYAQMRDCDRMDLSGAVAAWRRDGFVVLPGYLDGPELDGSSA